MMGGNKRQVEKLIKLTELIKVIHGTLSKKGVSRFPGQAGPRLLVSFRPRSRYAFFTNAQSYLLLSH
jgi:hypothetical protein